MNCPYPRHEPINVKSLATAREAARRTRPAIPSFGLFAGAASRLAANPGANPEAGVPACVAPASGPGTNPALCRDVPVGELVGRDPQTEFRRTMASHCSR
jgi:hypothetical protein